MASGEIVSKRSLTVETEAGSAELGFGDVAGVGVRTMNLLRGLRYTREEGDTCAEVVGSFEECWLSQLDFGEERELFLLEIDFLFGLITALSILADG